MSQRIDWSVVGAYAKAALAGRVGREAEPSPGTALAVDWAQVAAYRAAVTGLDRRRPHEEIADAARGGLQDSSPRAGLFALHCRVEGIGPADWEHPDLVQIWFRWADYVVPREDLGVFTLGALPRDPEQIACLDALAARVLAVLDGRPRSSREVMEAIGGLPNPHLVKAASVTGRILIRWDASSIDVVPVERPDVDVDEARAELVRRFLHWHGPANVQHFAKWAGIPRPDAETTWRELQDQLVPVAVDGRARWLLAGDEEALLQTGSEPLEGVRFLPSDDPFLYFDRGLAFPAPPASIAGHPLTDGVTPRLLNSLTGRVLADGRMVASWGRSQGRVTIAPWRALGGKVTDRLTAEAESFAQLLGVPARAQWLKRA